KRSLYERKEEIYEREAARRYKDRLQAARRARRAGLEGAVAVAENRAAAYRSSMVEAFERAKDAYREQLADQLRKYGAGQA
ncbi:MAG: hypothetical protein M1435_03290, partial [Actinobacteria bacterium]|nr:hypothetical protein [Actinomycetota bacterium]